jgi:hypothetical protein
MLRNRKLRKPRKIAPSGRVVANSDRAGATRRGFRIETKVAPQN